MADDTPENHEENRENKYEEIIQFVLGLSKKKRYYPQTGANSDGFKKNSWKLDENIVDHYKPVPCWR